MTEPVYIVFDGPPGPDCRLVEVETKDGKGVALGDDAWEKMDGGLYRLGPLYQGEQE